MIPLFIMAGPHSTLDEQAIETARKSYGAKAGARTANWRELVARGKREVWSEQRALSEVNRFFNRLQFINDYALW
ncbi:MAG: transglutaminase-like cysteine peptidase, partial [Aeromonadaceae bacterium]